jgi:hypothetical protein
MTPLQLQVFHTDKVIIHIDHHPLVIIPKYPYTNPLKRNAKMVKFIKRMDTWLCPTSAWFLESFDKMGLPAPTWKMFDGQFRLIDKLNESLYIGEVHRTIATLTTYEIKEIFGKIDSRLRRVDD